MQLVCEASEKIPSTFATFAIEEGLFTIKSK